MKLLKNIFIYVLIEYLIMIYVYDQLMAIIEEKVRLQEEIDNLKNEIIKLKNNKNNNDNDNEELNLAKKKYENCLKDLNKEKEDNNNLEEQFDNKERE